VAALQAADATCSLAGIWLALGPSHGPQAAQQLRSILPTVLGNADTDLQARVQLLLAQALLADASTADLRADPAGYAVALNPVCIVGQCSVFLNIMLLLTPMHARVSACCG